ncbi:MAG: putative DNA binding domain-containing protein [Bifidobacteriaceae bacterium]|nr:putative DNA binding domain-containing protein [Bifidobacteriaceae bacterium]
MARLRLAGTDLEGIEAKRASGGMPRSLLETISAFANGVGGLVILGLDEEDGFMAVPTEVGPLADAVAVACRDLVEPAVAPDIDIVPVDGTPVVAAWIPELDRARKPCFVKSQGLERGSYLRAHDGDRHLTTYEVHVLVEGGGQPHDDAAPVPGAALADLDGDQVARLLARVKTVRGPVFGSVEDCDILRMLGVVVDGPDGADAISLAGLLALGRYPQQLFPQLDVTFVAYKRPDGRPMRDGTRFADNVSIDGPIPLQVTQAIAAVERNTLRGARITGAGREDLPEFPEEAVRELVVNALMHRDYHPLAQGTQVRVELYPDRLVVTNPGGLYGPISPDDLLAVPVSSSRNPVLAKLLEDVQMPGVARTVCENRGTGLFAVSAALRDAGMAAPEIHTNLRSFSVTLKSNAYSAPPSPVVTVAPAASATSASPAQVVTPGDTRQPAQEVDPILDLLAAGPARAIDIAQRLGISRTAVTKRLDKLSVAGQVVPTEENRYSPRNAWALAPGAGPRKP